jgi:hypothetical protein
MTKPAPKSQTLRIRYDYITAIRRTDSTEYHPTVDAGCRSPLIDGAFRPHGDRNGADVLPFANEVSNDRVLLADLEVFHPESHHLTATQSASDEQRHYRAITFAAQARGRRLLEHGFGLIRIYAFARRKRNPGRLAARLGVPLDHATLAPLDR